MMTPDEEVARLVGALDNLPFVETVSSSGTESSVKVLCRVRSGTEKHWAKVVEKILRAAEYFEFHAHVCRLYVLHGGNMVYGWHIELISDPIDYALDAILPLMGKKPQAKPQPQQKKPASPKRSNKGSTDLMKNYRPPLQSDRKGNPIVKRQVTEMPFTGMEDMKDRNTPSPPHKDGRGGGKGAVFTG